MAIRTKCFILAFLFVIPLLPASAAPTAVGADMTIGRMRVMIWPEHDDTGILVVYDGRFVEEEKFPTKADFLIPKDVVINDICSLSPGGQHFCQLYEIEKGKDLDIAHLSLPYSNFYVSFHTPSLDMKSENRSFDYMIKANHPIRSLEVDIKQPLRSSDFNIFPAGGEMKEKKGFNHYKYTLEDIAKGEEKVFKIGYVKKDAAPSVEIKFASMSGPRVWGSPYDAQRNTRTIIYAVFGTGLAAAVAGISWIVIMRRRRKAQI